MGGGEAGGAEDGGVADFDDVAFEGATGHGVDGDVGDLIEFNVDDVGFVHFDFGGDDGHVGDGHDERRRGILNAGDDGFADADGEVSDDAVDGGDRLGTAENVGGAAEIGFRDGDAALGGGEAGAELFDLSAGLSEAGLTFADGGFGGLNAGAAGIVVLAGD